MLVYIGSQSRATNRLYTLRHIYITSFLFISLHYVLKYKLMQQARHALVFGPYNCVGYML